MGFGEVPFECYERAEAAFESALAVAAKCGKWTISEQDAPVIERLLALHDQQLSEAPTHRVVEAEKQLRQFLAGTTRCVGASLSCWSCSASKRSITGASCSLIVHLPHFAATARALSNAASARS